MILDPSLLLALGAATVGGAVASHLPSIVAWGAAKMTAGKSAAQSLESRAVNDWHAFEGTAVSALLHPVTAVQNAEHAVVLKAAEEAGKLAAYLTDKSPEQAKRAAIDAVEAAKNKALDDLIAKLQAARQQ
jgi:hypothetical protein